MTLEEAIKAIKRDPNSALELLNDSKLAKQIINSDYNVLLPSSIHLIDKLEAFLKQHIATTNKPGLKYEIEIFHKSIHSATLHIESFIHTNQQEVVKISNKKFPWFELTIIIGRFQPNTNPKFKISMHNLENVRSVLTEIVKNINIHKKLLTY